MGRPSKRYNSPPSHGMQGGEHVAIGDVRRRCRRAQRAFFWAFDPSSGQVHHLSHFGDRRLGLGTGDISPGGDLRLTLRFTDKPDGTYRVYEYIWISPNEYSMMSRQFDSKGGATGNWYGGTVVRLRK